MKDEHLPYFCDLQYDLILFSEMKSRVENLTKDKVKIQEANEMLRNSSKKLQSDLEASESSKRMIFQSLKTSNEEKNKYYRECCH